MNKYSLIFTRFPIKTFDRKIVDMSSVCMFFHARNGRVAQNETMF